MMPGFRFIFVVFCLTGMLIFAVALRSADNHIFYQLYSVEVEQNRLRQKLWQKQLQVENLINLAAILHQVDETNSGN